MLRQIEPSTVVLQAGASTEGLSTAEAHCDLDAVILDLTMPGMDGFSAIQEFGRRCPDLPVIVLSASEGPLEVRRALAAGALGYVPKSANPHTLLSALKLVLSGEVYVPPLLLDHIAVPRQTGVNQNHEALDGRLTERQTEVLKLIVQGLSNKEIATALDLSEKTVKAHVTAIFRALNVVNRTQAAVAARQGGGSGIKLV